MQSGEILSQEGNRVWASQVIRRFDPDFRFIWEHYHAEILAILNPKMVWLDIGSGKNSQISEFGVKARFAAGLDLESPAQKIDSPFVAGALPSLPFKTESADLLTLHFVVEHLQNISAHFTEIFRVLKPGGKLILVTTNTWSPYILAARCFPFFLKNFLIRSIYRVDAEDVFPTFHAFNTPEKFKESGLYSPHRLIKLLFLQDVNYERKWLFWLFFAGHLLTRRKMGFLRTNLLGVFEKSS